MRRSVQADIGDAPILLTQRPVAVGGFALFERKRVHLVDCRGRGLRVAFAIGAFGPAPARRVRALVFAVRIDATLYGRRGDHVGLQVLDRKRDETGGLVTGPLLDRPRRNSLAQADA